MIKSKFMAKIIEDYFYRANLLLILIENYSDQNLMLEYDELYKTFHILMNHFEKYNDAVKKGDISQDYVEMILNKDINFIVEKNLKEQSEAFLEKIGLCISDDEVKKIKSWIEYQEVFDSKVKTSDIREKINKFLIKLRKSEESGDYTK